MGNKNRPRPEDGIAEHVIPPSGSMREPLGDRALSHILHGDVDQYGNGLGWHFAKTGDGKKGTRIVDFLSGDRHGVYTAVVEINGKRKKAASTFFPDRWTQEEVVQSIHEAYARRRAKQGAPESIVQGTCSRGITIEMRLYSDGTIQSAYPVQEK